MGNDPRVTINARHLGNVGSSICLCRAPRRLSSRRGGFHRPPGGSSRMIHGNTNGRAATTGRRLSREGEFRCVELATWPNCITVRARAMLIILILVRTFRAYPSIRRHLCHHGRLPQLFLVAMIPSGELRHHLQAQLAVVGGHSNLK